MLASTISLAMVDDHPLFRKSIADYLSSTNIARTIVQASHSKELFQKLKNTVIDVLLLDIFIPYENVRDTITQIREQYPKTKIILLTMCSDLEFINELIDLGIHGYIPKVSEPEDLLQAIKAISEGRIYQNRAFTQALYWNKENNINNVDSESVMILSEREKIILKLLWEEKSNKEIAQQVFLSVRSIEKIRQDIKDKLGIKSTVGLLKYALQREIILAPEYIFQK